MEYPAQQTNNNLPKIPPGAESCEQPLMAPRYELEEDQAVDGDIPSSSGADDSPYGTEGDEVLRAGRRAGEDAADEECGVEGGLASDEVGGHAPDEGAEDEAHVVGDGGVGDDGDVGELELDEGLDGADSLGPEVVGDPAEAGHYEEFPLVSLRLLVIGFYAIVVN